MPLGSDIVRALDFIALIKDFAIRKNQDNEISKDKNEL